MKEVKCSSCDEGEAAPRPRAAQAVSPKRPTQVSGADVQQEFRARAANLLWPEGAPFPPIAPWLAGLVDRGSAIQAVMSAKDQRLRQSQAGENVRVDESRVYYHPALLSFDDFNFDSLAQLLADAYVQVQVVERGRELTPALLAEADAKAQKWALDEYPNLLLDITTLRAIADSVLEPKYYVWVDLGEKKHVYHVAPTHGWELHDVSTGLDLQVEDYVGLPVENWQPLSFETMFGEHSYSPATRTAYEIMRSSAVDQLSWSSGENNTQETGSSGSTSSGRSGGSSRNGTLDYESAEMPPADYGGLEDGSERVPGETVWREYEHGPVGPSRGHWRREEEDEDSDDEDEAESTEGDDICSWCPRGTASSWSAIDWDEEFMALWALTLVYQHAALNRVIV